MSQTDTPASPTSATIPIIERVASHITLDDKGIARIDGSRFKVIHLVEAMKAWFPTVPELIENYPQLTRAQIHAALAYYYDHQAEIDGEIEREVREYDKERAAAPETPGRKKLRDLGYLP